MWNSMIETLSDMFSYPVMGIPMVYITIALVLALIVFLAIKRFVKLAILVTLAALFIIYVLPNLTF